MTLLSAAKSTKVVAILSFTVALFYYQHASHVMRLQQVSLPSENWLSHEGQNKEHNVKDNIDDNFGVHAKTATVNGVKGENITVNGAKGENITGAKGEDITLNGAKGDNRTFNGAKGENITGATGENITDNGAKGDNRTVNGAKGENRTFNGANGDTITVNGAKGDNRTVHGAKEDNITVNGAMGENRTVNGANGDNVTVNGAMYSSVNSRQLLLGRNLGISLPLLKPSNGSALSQIDLSGYSKEDQTFLRRRLRVIQKRAQRVSRVCSEKIGLQNSGNLHLVWDIKRSPSILFCPIYKVGSTSWMINFLRLAHFNEDNPELLKIPPRKRKRKQFTAKYGAKQSRVYELFPPPTNVDERERLFRKSLRMVVVRHPFARLISAYRDKMTKMNPRPIEHKFRKLQRRIISQYRLRNSTETSPFPTFAEFAQHVIDSTKDLHTRSQWMQHVKCWVPYWSECNICGADFNLILQLETSKPDFNFVVKLARMEELKKIRDKSEWRHLRNGTSSSDLIIEYFSQLTRHQIQQLKLRYLLDFELFGYKIDPKVWENAKD